MDWYPLYNSLRIALISTVIIFFAGIAGGLLRCASAACAQRRAGCAVHAAAGVLPPTVVGYLLLRVLGPTRAVGAWALTHFNLKLTMVLVGGGFRNPAVVIFPLMYRTARGAFESFDETLADAGRTLGRSNTWIFWRVRMPCCRQGILAGTVLAFARALGEYGATSMVAGYTPGRTATISTTVYQLWRTNDDALAFKWVVVNLAISAVVLLAVNLLEKRERGVRKAWH